MSWIGHNSPPRARAYYNEFDPFAAQWIREMIGLGVIPPGEVDDRSIKDVTPNDLKGFTQCHFFAGIGGWGYAARLAGWPDDRPLWTGSCPCQPFSEAGAGLGFDDPRDLWPDFRRLVRARRPVVVVGEQVAGKAGLHWFDRTHAHLARDGYASRVVRIPGCAVDSPQERQRLWWAAVTMAGAGGERPVGRPGQPGGHDVDGYQAGRSQGAGRLAERHASDMVGAAGAGSQGIADAQRFNRNSGGRSDAQRADGRDGRPCDLGGAPSGGFAGAGKPEASWRPARGGQHRRPDGRNGTFWSGAEWIICHDDKARRAEPGSPLLAHGIPARVPKWRGFGNAIVPQLAAEVLGALIDVLPPHHGGADDFVGRAAA